MFRRPRDVRRQLPSWRRFLKSSAMVTVALASLFAIVGGTGPVAPADERDKTPRSNERKKPASQAAYVVFGFNDLGMHCMNQSFAELCILPPFNNLHAQVVQRGEEPKIVKTGATINYSVPGNTYSVGKTDFWNYSQALFGARLNPNIGLTGNGLSGVMKPTGDGDWAATGIPITPITDLGALNPYPLGHIEVTVNRKVVAKTDAVIPVSWEIRCDLCHSQGPGSVDSNILSAHDKLHKTNLVQQKPVLCASCHADPALGTKGVPGVTSMSHAMHGAHASRMNPVVNITKGNTCYACHPGVVTNCQRDIHFAKNIQCVDCHGDMAAVANPTRTPWLQEPTCGSCHQKRRPKFQFEEPGKQFRNSRGHGGVMCASCHGSPHVIAPAVTPVDNLQAVSLQGFAGTIQKCTVCHTKTPHDPFPHRLFGEGTDD